MPSSGSKKHSSKKVCLGIITGVHGIHGEVVIKSYTSNPLDIKSYGVLSDQANQRQFIIGKARMAKKGVVARLEGIDGRNGAEALKGVGLYVDHARLPEPDNEDEFYFTDLIGLKVVLADGRHYGTITALHNFGAGDLIEIKPFAGKGSDLYPFDKKTVPEVNLAKGQLTFNPPEMIEMPKTNASAPRRKS